MEEQGRQSTGFKYMPLMVVFAGSVLAALAKQYCYQQWSFHMWMLDFMGFYMVTFGMVKLFDLPGFAESFQKYDLLGKQSHVYAMAYPFIELLLGLGFLANFKVTEVSIATLVIMSVGALGILLALKRGMNTESSCMGTAMKAQLSMVSLIEQVGMAAMAGAMLAMPGGMPATAGGMPAM